MSLHNINAFIELFGSNYTTAEDLGREKYALGFGLDMISKPFIKVVWHQSRCS